MNLEMWLEGVDCIHLDQDRGCVTETCLCSNETSSATEVCAICWIAKRLLCVQWRGEVDLPVRLEEFST